MHKTILAPKKKNEVERHQAFTRLNPSGDEELVTGDDETLNEIAEELLNLMNGIDFAGPTPIGGGVGSSEQLEYQRNPNQPDAPLMVGASGDQVRNNGDSITNLRSSTRPAADGPEQSRAKSRHRVNMRGSGPRNKYITGRAHDGVDYSTTQSESFTGTGAIAIVPGYSGNQKKRKKKKPVNESRRNLRFATLWYVPPDGEPTPENLEEARQLLRTDFRIREYDEHPGEPPSTWTVGEDYGFVVLELPKPLPEGTHLKGRTIEIVVEPPPEYAAMDESDPDYPSDLNSPMESNMSTEQVLTEWEPKFASGEYSPGDHQMPSPTGDGVAERKPKKDKVGQYDTDTSAQGKEWPRDHKETEAMGKVENDGTDHHSQDSHESSVGDPKDGHQTEVGHNWPDEAKNSGSGVAEPFEGDRWSDGGTLKGSGADEGDDVSSSGPGMPKEGPITGTSGPQLGQPQEGWDRQEIGTLMEDEYDIQGLFDSYARDYEYVCVEDFQTLCNAHGVAVMLNEGSLLNLMEDNQEFIFYEGEDANGKYWSPTPIAQPKTVNEGDDEDCEPCDDDDDDDFDAHEWQKLEEGEDRRPFGQPISELQVRSPEEEALPYGDFQTGRRPIGDPDFGSIEGSGEVSRGPNDADNYEQMLAGSQAQDSMHGPGHLGHHDSPNNVCPECGYEGPDEACPECGMTMSGGEDFVQPDRFGMGGEADQHDIDEIVDDEAQYGSPTPGANRPRPPIGGRLGETRLVIGPEIMESLQNFMASARAIIENNQDFRPHAIGEALNYSWIFHARKINPDHAPAKVQRTLASMMQKYPGFKPVTESDEVAMSGPDGTKIGTGSGPSSSKFLAEKDQPSPDDIQDHGDPLGKSQKNTYEKTPVVTGTHKGMDGKGSVAQTVRENVARLSKHVQANLKQAAQGLSNKGKYDVAFSVLVKEGSQKNRTKHRSRLAEALADAEEILQLHDSEDVALEASFSDQSGAVILKSDIPLITISPRGVLASEDKALFRFQRTAENFANELVAEGVTCRVIDHNWGCAVLTKAPQQIVEGAFATLIRK